MEKGIVVSPIPTIKRLPRYIRLLKEMKKENVEYVSAAAIADQLGIEGIQVRKDISVTGIIGKPKKGYILEELLSTLISFLNWDNKTDAFLVGAGALGSAILGYKSFKNYGLNIVAAFDTDEQKVGNSINNIEIFNIARMPDLAQRMKIRIGVITTTGDSAQSTAEQLVESGIRAIWNFAPVELKLPDEIIVENVSLSQSLAVLTHKLSKLNDVLD